MKKQIKGSLYIVLATSIWGSTFVAQSIGMDFIGPFTFQAVRCMIAAVGLLPFIFIADCFKHDGETFLSRWKNKKLWIAGLLCGLPLFLANNLQQLGISSTDAGKSAFLTALYIVIVPIIGIFRRQRPSKMVFVSILVAVAGLYFLCCTGPTSFATGDLFLIGCAFTFAIQITFIDIFADSVDALRLNVIQAFICAVLSGIPMFTIEAPNLQTIMDCWFPLFYAGFLSMGIGFSMQIIGQKHLEATTASILMSLESAFAVLFGWLILNEHMTSMETLGCVLVFSAVLLAQVPIKPKKVRENVSDCVPCHNPENICT